MQTKYDLKETETYSRPNMEMNNSSNDEDEISTNSTNLSNSKYKLFQLKIWFTYLMVFKVQI